MQCTIREFLISLDANKTRHSGRTLFDHLKGVHDLLRDWDNEHYVCMAGLFHSIYGTNTFKHQSLNDRGKLIEMIGLKAENLVHLFSTADRPLFESIEDKKVRSDLLEIEAANLLEQGGNVNTLRKLARRRELSNGARAALNCGVV
jgi:(p)ppGpp synthase/HD superfamily hydrolase